MNIVDISDAKDIYGAVRATLKFFKRYDRVPLRAFLNKISHELKLKNGLHPDTENQIIALLKEGKKIVRDGNGGTYVLINSDLGDLVG